MDIAYGWIFLGLLSDGVLFLVADFDGSFSGCELG